VLAGLLVAGALYLALKKPAEARAPTADELHEVLMGNARLAAREQMRTALKNAATAQELYFVGNGSYTMTFADLETEGGLTYPPQVTLTIVSVTPTSYCIEATHEDLVDIYYSYDSRVGTVEGGRCEGF
jgi:hypothetical protein